MTDIIMLPFQGPMYAELHEHAAQATGRTYFVAGDLVDAREHLEAEGMPKLAVIDFGWTRGIMNSLDSSLVGIREVPSILVYGVGNDSSIHGDFNFIATVGAEDQCTSILQDMMSTALEQIEKTPAAVLTAKTFKFNRQKVLAAPQRPVDLLMLPPRRFRA